MKKVLITGASSPLGKLFSEYFGKRGFFLFLQYRGHHHKVDEFLRNFRGEGVEFEFKEGNLKEWIKEVEIISPDVVVNNFGPFLFKKFDKVEPEEWEWIFFSNTTLSYYTALSSIKSMLRRGYGRIINVGFHNLKKEKKIFPNVLPYAISKGALCYIIETLANELKDKGVTVNMISPNTVKTKYYPKDSKEIDKNELFSLLNRIIETEITGENFYI